MNAILKMLRLHPRVAMAWRQNVGMAEFDGRPVRFGFVGQSDICGVMRGGRALFLEVKRPGQKPTPAQEAVPAGSSGRWRTVAVVHSVDEAAAALAEAGVWSK